MIDGRICAVGVPVFDMIREQIDGIATAHEDAARWLPGTVRELSPHRYWSGRRPRLVRPAESIVWHYTASPYNARFTAGADVERIKRWARGTGRKSSTHVVYLRDGRRVQLMPLSDRAWHVTNKYPHPVTGARLNESALAFDLESVGYLRKSGGVYLNAYGGTHRGPVEHDATGRPWEAITDEQLRAIEDDAATIGRWFPQLGDGARGRVIGHSAAQPTRSDPGPLFDLEWYAGLIQKGAA